jgi:hypothetical protein
VAGQPPYPPSTTVARVTWDDEVIPRGDGMTGDNWAMAWGDDNRIYTTWGDGYGFDPTTPRLTIGFATVEGTPPTHQGANLRTNTDILPGWGKLGLKSSGLLMVDGKLYLWVRNWMVAGSPAQDPWRHAKLAVSLDHGKTYQWTDWHFGGSAGKSFACPDFVQFGPNYAGARDDYVHLVSQDGDSAYDYHPDVVLARVPKDRIIDRTAYEFFAGLGSDGEPRWSSSLGDRRPSFTDPNGAQRVSITYNAPLKRYFLVTSHQVGDPIDRTAVHTPALGVFDAPEPWGPWTTAYYSDAWSDTGGWTIHHRFPTKWISPDGTAMWLVFSGNNIGPRDDPHRRIQNCLLVRKATLELVNR